MKIVGISGSTIGSKTRVAVDHALKYIEKEHTGVEAEMLDLKDYDMVFSDGRSYKDYTGDTKILLEKIMQADGILLGMPVFQASIPGTLKNLFDLLPMDAFRNKVVAIIATAGTTKHYLVPEQHLKPILHYMHAWVIPKYVFVEEKDYTNYVISNQNVIDRLNKLSDDLIHYVDLMQKHPELTSLI
ncbi:MULTISPECIES: NADPH-dependent FMN reductase [Oceanobacillus]|uniref:NAD(P)H-dependent FAD/FMN reductase n=2 Tax=Oceanobacillus TaxID=182709 RepID=A0A0A1MLN7_9BACI|nr:NADPH-dependent FMN reductase [Oceanobacillus oncorhynchi]MDM8098987.1 NADPH-dependent FMN reductase [Oceanobacillus oncorhynchi]CEI80597.1 NAD(P)H-dependent FAD/FMN reductase [Oceanobacillus oncorhynchi]